MLRGKELYWLIGTLVHTLILNFAFFGSKGFKMDSVVDLNIHDTYYLIGTIYVAFVLSVFVFFVVYLIRTLHRNFKNMIANIILMGSIMLFILAFTFINSIIAAVIQQNTGWSIHPPLNAGSIEDQIETKENYLGVLKNVIYGIQILLLILLTYCGFKTGRNYKQNHPSQSH